MFVSVPTPESVFAPTLSVPAPLLLKAAIVPPRFPVSANVPVLVTSGVVNVPCAFMVAELVIDVVATSVPVVVSVLAPELEIVGAVKVPPKLMKVPSVLSIAVDAVIAPPGPTSTAVADVLLLVIVPTLDSVLAPTLSVPVPLLLNAVIVPPRAPVRANTPLLLTSGVLNVPCAFMIAELMIEVVAASVPVVVSVPAPELEIVGAVKVPALAKVPAVLSIAVVAVIAPAGPT